MLLGPDSYFQAKANRLLATYWLNRKNCCVTEMGLVTVFCPLTTTDGGELVVQALQGQGCL